MAGAKKPAAPKYKDSYFVSYYYTGVKNGESVDGFGYDHIETTGKIKYSDMKTIADMCAEALQKNKIENLHLQIISIFKF